MDFTLSKMLPLAALLSLPLLAISDPRPAVESEVLLKPFVVKSDPINSYAFALTVSVDTSTKKIARLIITAVGEDSDAERAGLRNGDEIVRINGLPVSDLNPDLGPNGQFHQWLINRPVGEKLNIEVVTKRTMRVTLNAAEPVHLP